MPMKKAHFIINSKILWVFYLIITLVYVQGAQLHVHLYDHHHDHNQHNSVVIDVDNHEHHDQVHSAHNASDAQHALDLAATVDLSSEGFLNKLSLVSIVFALLVAAVIFVLRRHCTRTLWRRQKNTPLFTLQRTISPPLRAPPL